MLQGQDLPLIAAYDLAMFDLDGVVYVGGRAVDGAPEQLLRVRETGTHLAFVTNNASRTPSAVARLLRDLGVEADETDVVTSAQAAAHLLREAHGAAARVFLLGGEGLEAALVAEELVPVTSLSEAPVAVVSGYGPDVPWRRLMQGAVLIRDGLPWVASNTDMTIPTGYGIGPGHGVQVRMLSEFSGVTPTVAGKPEPALVEETIRRVGGTRPLMIGDRLDTDIEGAQRAGLPSLCVLTGVTGLSELVAAPPHLRPTYLSPDLGGLFEPHPKPLVVAGRARVGGWSAGVMDGALRAEGAGDAADWWRAVVSAAWLYFDATGVVADGDGLVPPGER